MLCTKKISTYGISTAKWALKSTCHSTWRPLRPLKVGEFMKLQDCRLMNLLTSFRQHHHISSLAYPPLSLSLCLFSLLCQEKSISRHFPVIIHVVPIIHRSHLCLHSVHLHRAYLASSDPLQSFSIIIVLLVRVIFREGYISSQFWHHLLFCHSIRQEVYFPPF